MPVDLYIGGAEHAVGHLLLLTILVRSFFYDIGVVPGTKSLTASW